MPVIAHLSDSHLDGSQQRLRRLLGAISESASAGADAVIVTGDLADDGTTAEYEQIGRAHV